MQEQKVTLIYYSLPCSGLLSCMLQLRGKVLKVEASTTSNGSYHILCMCTMKSQRTNMLNGKCSEFHCYIDHEFH